MGPIILRIFTLSVAVPALRYFCDVITPLCERSLHPDGICSMVFTLKWCKSIAVELSAIICHLQTPILMITTLWCFLNHVSVTTRSFLWQKYTSIFPCDFVVPGLGSQWCWDLIHFLLCCSSCYWWWCSRHIFHPPRKYLLYSFIIFEVQRRHADQH